MTWLEVASWFAGQDLFLKARMWTLETVDMIWSSQILKLILPRQYVGSCFGFGIVLASLCVTTK